MEVSQNSQMYYLSTGKLKKFAVRKPDWDEYLPISIETVEISPSTCIFEREGRQEFQVWEVVNFYFATQDFLIDTEARIVWVTKCEFLDDGYEHRVWFSYGADFLEKLDSDFFHGIAGDRKRRTISRAEVIPWR